MPKLTPEQEAKIPEYHAKWKKIALCTDRADRPKAEKAVLELYQLAGIIEPPQIMWADDPLQGAQLASEFVKDYFKDKEKPEDYNYLVRNAFSSWIAGSLWAGSACWADFLNNECGQDVNMAYADAVSSVGYYFCLEGLVVLTERPSKINLDSQNRLHSFTEKALEYPSGWGLYVVHGVQVPEKVVMNPAAITAQEILTESNAEVRRIMLDIFGRARLLAEANAEVLHEDTDKSGHPRQLLKLVLPDDEDIIAISVLNSTLEPDGSRKPYFLFPHPELRPIKTLADGTVELINGARPQAMTCHNAVASTFGEYGEDYGRNGQFRQGDVLISFRDGTNLETSFQES